MVKKGKRNENNLIAIRFPSMFRDIEQLITLEFFINSIQLDQSEQGKRSETMDATLSFCQHSMVHFLINKTLLQFFNQSLSDFNWIDVHHFFKKIVLLVLINGHFGWTRIRIRWSHAILVVNKINGGFLRNQSN